MFRRGGNTPKMSHFFGRTNSVSSVPEEDEDAGNEADSDDSSSLSSEGGRRHSSGSSLVESLSAEEAEKLASCLDYILDIVGEAIPEIQGMYRHSSYNAVLLYRGIPSNAVFSKPKTALNFYLTRFFQNKNKKIWKKKFFGQNVFSLFLI